MTAYIPTKNAKPLVNPKKLMHSKWTASNPVNKEKHFMVTKVILPELMDQPIELIELEAVFSGRKQLIAWKQLNDAKLWLRGWK